MGEMDNQRATGEMAADIVIIGGGTGGVAAALAATDLGYRVILTEETDWIGGQLTSQGVPPDEHPWIEQFGCTARYREYRNRVRAYYRDHTPLTNGARNNRQLNPGGGWVSRLCHEPRIGWQVLCEMVQSVVISGRLTILLNSKAHLVDVEKDRICSLTVQDNVSLDLCVLSAPYFLDATELGDLLPLSGAEYRVGAESQSQTGEPNALAGAAEADNVQGLTWCMALALDEGSHRVIDKPAEYDHWRTYQPEFWPGPLLGFDVLHAHTGEARNLPLFGKEASDWYALFPYRQIVNPLIFDSPAEIHPITLVNWPQNDYFAGSILDVPDSEVLRHLNSSKQLSLSLLYWLQTAAPRHDGGVGYPGLYPARNVLGTEDGFAKYPYIRESRRLEARTMVREQDIAAYTNPGRDRAPEMEGSVGIGAYRIDLHPSTNGANTIDTSTLPFQIPLGALIPVRLRNLLPACKNLGVTHITNGCYRLHPVEWNIGESSALLAAFCLSTASEPAEVLDSKQKTADYQRLLVSQGIELEWPVLRAL